MAWLEAHRRRGVTLVELLVVITIMLIVAGVVLPMAQPAIRKRAVKDAAGQVQAFLMAAQNRAYVEQQIVGVQIERVNLTTNTVPSNPPPPYQNYENNIIHDNDVGYRLTEVRLPAPNSGIPTEITAFPVPQLHTSWRDFSGFSNQSPPRGFLTWEEFLKGAIIQLGNFPTLYRLDLEAATSLLPQDQPAAQGIRRWHLQILDSPCDEPLPPRPDPNAPVTVPAAALYPPQIPLPVKIYSGFVGKRISMGNTIELPVGTYIDLSWSGTLELRERPNNIPRRRQGKFWDDGKPVTLLFGPDGKLQFLGASMDVGIPGPQGYRYRRAWPVNAGPAICSPFRPRFDVYLLVSNARMRQENSLVNFLPASGSLWVIISPRTGFITTADNLGVTTQAFRDQITSNPPPTFIEEAWLHEMRQNSSKAISAGP